MLTIRFSVSEALEKQWSHGCWVGGFKHLYDFEVVKSYGVMHYYAVLCENRREN